jgi:hypothetical protein
LRLLIQFDHLVTMSDYEVIESDWLTIGRGLGSIKQAMTLLTTLTTAAEIRVWGATCSCCSIAEGILKDTYFGVLVFFQRDHNLQDKLFFKTRET